MATDLLTAADIVAHASTLPTERAGSVLQPFPGVAGAFVPGWSIFEAQARTIKVPALRWPRSRDTYEDMARDPQIQGLLNSVYLPIRHMDWYVDPGQSTGTLAEEIAEDLGIPLQGQDAPDDVTGVDFDDHLRLALLALAGGHQAFQEVGVIEGDGPGAKYRLRQLIQAPQETIHEIWVSDVGDLVSIRLPAADPDVDGPFVDVPAEHLLYYCWDRRGADWSGRPILYSLYRAWVLKDELVRGDVATKRRFGGIPIVEATQPNVGRTELQQAAVMATRLQSGDGAGVAMPYGTTLKILGVEGTIPDAIASAEYHDRQMARAFLQMFAELGNTRNGSRALGTTLMDHYQLGVIAVADWVRKTLMQLVARIAWRNYGPDVILPTIRYRQDDHEDMAITDLVAAIDAGLIVVDDALEAQVRDRGNLTPRAGAGRALPAPAAAPLPTPAAVAAAAPVGRHARAASGNTPAVPDAIASAGVDFAALQATYTAAGNRLRRQWADITATQIDDLVAQVQAATTPEQLAQITTGAAGADILLAELTEVMHDGAASAEAEAAHQGATVPQADRSIAQAAVQARAAATAELLASGLSQSAASRAVSLSGSLVGPDLADAVREHLERLAGSARDYELAGAVTHAQNEGRMAVMDQAPDSTRIYASELNDAAECGPCAEVDDTEYPNMIEARRDYGAGHYVGCEGGNRCRGTLVAVYQEDGPVAASAAQSPRIAAEAGAAPPAVRRKPKADVRGTLPPSTGSKRTKPQVLFSDDNFD